MNKRLTPERLQAFYDGIRPLLARGATWSELEKATGLSRPTIERRLQRLGYHYGSGNRVTGIGEAR